MAEQQTTAERIADLEIELRRRDEKIKELTEERDEAHELVNKMREHVEDTKQSADQWIDALGMTQAESGVWIFDPQQTEFWEKHDDLLKCHNELVRKWNKLVPRYNAAVQPQDIGRPLAASEVQQAEVLKRRKKGDSLRTIALASSLSLRTVRTIIDNASGKGRTGKRRQELRRKEFNRLRAAEYRAWKRTRDAIPKQLGDMQQAGDALVRAAKGLGR